MAKLVLHIRNVIHVSETAVKGVEKAFPTTKRGIPYSYRHRHNDKSCNTIATHETITYCFFHLCKIILRVVFSSMSRELHVKQTVSR